MKRGEIYYIENDKAVGCEQRGIRPAVIVGNDVGNKCSPVLLVVYFTRQHKKALPTHVYVRGHGTALCEQIFTIDKTRLLQKKKRENVQIAIWSVSIRHFEYRSEWRKHGKKKEIRLHTNTATKDGKGKRGLNSGRIPR